jgi:hypothetical protein
LGEYRKLISGEAVKGFTAGVVVILLPLLWQLWSTSDLEYKQVSINDYLSGPSTTFGKQGLTMTYEGKSLKNVSVVDFRIFNRTSKQFNDVELLFSVEEPKTPITLISGGIITPSSLPHAETVQELQVNDTRNKKFRLKVIPKQRKTEYFEAVFVFDGEKAPSMSVESYTNNVSIRPYQEWKDNIIVPYNVRWYLSTWRHWRYPNGAAGSS